MPAPIALGIIGFGINGELLLRAALDHGAEHVLVTGVWDHALSTAIRLGGVSAAVPMLGSAVAVIVARDCLYVTTPPAAHILMAGQPLAAGRAVFLEKPLATNLAAARFFVARAGSARAGR